MQAERLGLLYTFYKKENRNSLCKIIFTWLQLSGCNYFTFIIILKSLHLFPKCSGVEELTGSKFCNRNPLLSKHSIHGDEWARGKKIKPAQNQKENLQMLRCLGKHKRVHLSISSENHSWKSQSTCFSNSQRPSERFFHLVKLWREVRIFWGCQIGESCFDLKRNQAEPHYFVKLKRKFS